MERDLPNNDSLKAITDDRPFSVISAKKAIKNLDDYRNGKTSVDQKATENQQWWRLRHWDVITRQTNEAKKAGIKVGSAYAVNSILNKHADIMDSTPKPNILAREADDEAEAQALSNIVPAILEQNEYEKVYDAMAWDIGIDGAAITGVFWDNTVRDGLGDVSIKNIDVHNIFWQPGVQNIQDSKMLFYVSSRDVDDVKAMYPNIADKIGPYDSGYVTKYINDDTIDTSHNIDVVDCYYKKVIMVPITSEQMNPETRKIENVTLYEVPRTVVHLAIIIGGEIAFASENEPEKYGNGYYEHGKYPFVLRRLFPIKNSPWGFGYLDIMKNPQTDIDKLDQAIIKNAQMLAKPRYWTKKNSGVDKKAFADLSQDFVEVANGNINEQVGLLQVGVVPATAMNHLANKVDELKEISGNRDFSQGSTQSGVTAASAIAALQEAGSKLSRDINKELYRGFREECYLTIELVRQFYTEERSFRISDGEGGVTYTKYSNEGLIPRDITDDQGNFIRHKPGAVFDIKISAEKQSPFNRAAQNETAKEMYGMGVFNPDLATQSLAMLEMMDFEGKDKVVQRINSNNIMMQQFQAAVAIVRNAAASNPLIFKDALNAGLIPPEMLGEPQQNQPVAKVKKGNTDGKTAEERAADNTGKGDNSQAAKARKRVADSATPR